MVCASNVNRSVAAHALLQQEGLDVSAATAAASRRRSPLTIVADPLVPADAQVMSFGTGRRVKLPGPSEREPNCYDFGSWTYEAIMSECPLAGLRAERAGRPMPRLLTALRHVAHHADDLLAKDEQLYSRNGLVAMLRRDIAVKPAPQRWQDHRRAPPPPSAALPAAALLLGAAAAAAP